MSFPPFTLGMGQMLVEGGAREENLNRATRMIQQAAELGCAVLVLPECLDTGWLHPSAQTLSEAIPGPSSDLLCNAASRAGVHVAAGLTERDGDRIYNTAVLISPDGAILLKHRKINILKVAQDIYCIGDRLGVAHTPLGTFALDICADNFPNSLALGESLCRMGADIILSPSAWAVAADFDNSPQPYGGTWQDAYGQLSRLYGVWVVGVSNVGSITGGPWKGMKCIGYSLAMAPGARPAAQGPFGEEAQALVPVPVELTQRPAAGTDWADLLQERQQ